MIPRAVDGTALLGTGVGSDPFIVLMVRNRLVKIDDLLSTTRSMEDAQLEYILLRSCAGLPKFIHIMRTTSPQSLGPTLLEMDSLLEEACRSIMGNCALLDREVDKLRLPILYGGCGVLSALWLAQPAFIASTSVTFTLVITPHVTPYETLLCADTSTHKLRRGTSLGIGDALQTSSLITLVTLVCVSMSL